MPLHLQAHSLPTLSNVYRIYRPTNALSLPSLVALQVPFHPSAAPAQMAHSLLQFLGRRSLAPGEYLWRRGNEANDCYIIEKGSVRVSRQGRCSQGLVH